MASDAGRSRAARELAEAALASLLVHVGSRDDLVVIGGLNPDFLTSGAPSPHRGTTDVDLLIEVGFHFDRDERDFRWLEQAIQRAGLRRLTGGWRWRLDVEGTPVVLDVLCDAGEHPGQEIVLPGCETVTAMDLAGPGPALGDSVSREIVVPAALRASVAGAPAAVTARFVRLGGYVLAKAAAMVGRTAEKDVYDLVYVLLYNPDGPAAAGEAAARVLRRSPPTITNHRDIVREAARRLGSSELPGPQVFAEEMIKGGSSLDVDILVQDAVSAAGQFVDAFERTLSEWGEGSGT